MLSFILNGEQQTVDVDPETPLLWVLRDVLQVTGTKYGCGRGLCGACTVLLDEHPIRSCGTLMSQVAGREVITIEGLSHGEDHALQRVWIEDNVAQCGYCQAGQIMNAVGLLKENPKPSRDEIRRAMSGNLCRCGTYQRIENAIYKASGQE